MRRENGFSLIEAVLAIGLFAVVAVVLLSSFSRAVKVTGNAEQRLDVTDALRLAAASIGAQARTASRAVPNTDLGLGRQTLELALGDGTATTYICDDAQAPVRTLSQTASGSSVVLAQWVLPAGAGECFQVDPNHKELIISLDAKVPGAALQLRFNYALRNNGG